MAHQTLKYIREISETERTQTGKKTRERIIKERTAIVRAGELEEIIFEVLQTNQMPAF